MSDFYNFRKNLVFLRQLFWEAYRERLLVSIVATLVFCSLITILNTIYYDIGFWDSMKISEGIDTLFCEYTDMKNLIRQPINTFTNFIYLFNAVFIFSKGMEDIKKKRAYNLITANHFYSFILALIMIFVFLASTFFHSSLTDVASDVDFSGVYSITLFPLMYFSHRALLIWRGKPTNVKHWNERLIMIIIFTFLYILLTFILSLEYVHNMVLATLVMLILLGIYLEKKAPGSTRPKYLFATLASITIAMVFFKLDFAKILCDPHSFINPHSLWHLFNGMSMIFIYLYIRSEGYKPEFDDLRKNLRLRAEERMQHKFMKSNLPK